MADSPAPNAGAATGDPPISAALLAYALFGAARGRRARSRPGSRRVAPLMGIVGIIGLIVAYVKRDEAQGTWVASHLRWLIRTFWYSFLWGVVGGIVLLVLRRHPDRDPDRVPDLGRGVDLGDLPRDPRLPAVQGQKPIPGDVTRDRPALAPSSCAQRGGVHVPASR